MINKESQIKEIRIAEFLLYAISKWKILLFFLILSIILPSIYIYNHNLITTYKLDASYQYSKTKSDFIFNKYLSKFKTSTNFDKLFQFTYKEELNSAKVGSIINNIKNDFILDQNHNNIKINDESFSVALSSSLKGELILQLKSQLSENVLIDFVSFFKSMLEKNLNKSIRNTILFIIEEDKQHELAELYEKKQRIENSLSVVNKINKENDNVLINDIIINDEIDDNNQIIYYGAEAIKEIIQQIEFKINLLETGDDYSFVRNSLKTKFLSEQLLVQLIENSKSLSSSTVNVVEIFLLIIFSIFITLIFYLFVLVIFFSRKN